MRLVLLCDADLDEGGQLVSRRWRAGLGECFDVGSKDWPTSSKCAVQFVGPTGSKQGTIFLGDVVY